MKISNNILKILPFILFAFLASCSCSKKAGYGMGDSNMQSSMGDSSDYQSGMPDRVFFAFDSAAVTEDGMAVIMENAQWLSDNPDYDAMIEGHCDIRGTAEYNLALGASRANSVRQLLIENGVSPHRIKTVSYGKERPELIGDSEEVHQANRRAVVMFTESM